MECRKDKNFESCICSYEPCKKKGICCESIRYHIKYRDLPGCVFLKNDEKTYDRSFDNFAKLVLEKAV